ncbi:hypothetical protein SCHPADRAFT_935976 [Schizopora paradoxa]|uniref:G-protein coupled receptors family 1 profile domain-containing protein n=1 Tax=Schizopora paradoxa TaxID=27342 RepID=A0A0H2SNS0_9AGAM|nr:hypothetical protein SCHPADRAFT_935976 [Schizopora paradoxa]
MSSASQEDSVFAIRTGRTLLDGTVIAGAAYGVVFTLTCQSLHLLLFYPRNKKIQWLLVGYVSMLFALSTISFGTELKFNELEFVDNQNYPGGILAYNYEQYNIPVNVATFASSFVATWFSDAFLSYRLYVFSQRNILFIIAPSILLTGSIVVSIILLHQIANPSITFWTGSYVHYGAAYWALSTSLNLLVTGTILGRILLWRRTIRKEFKRMGVKRMTLCSEGGGTSIGNANAFRGTVAILLESAVLSLIVGVFFLIVYVKGSIVMNVMMPVLGQVIVIAPMLIVLRVAQGSAWTQETVASASNIEFDPRAASGRSAKCPREVESFSSCDTVASVDLERQTDMCHDSGSAVTRVGSQSFSRGSAAVGGGGEKEESKVEPGAR